MPQSVLPRSLFLRLSPLLLCGCIMLSSLTAHAQSFQLMRFDEDYSYLKDSTRNFYQSIKFVPLSADNEIYASFGGEARLEYAAFDNEDWGAHNIGHDNFLLQRYDVHADLHLGSRIRFFAQLRSAWEDGRQTGPRPIDEDKLNIQNLFADVSAVKNAKDSLTFRIGRQEMDYGSGRLISVREGPNLRLYFTGAKAMFAAKGLHIDAFAMMADTVNPGAFDNKPSKELNLWGVYGTAKLHGQESLDFYYIGIRRDSAIFEEGTEKEIRHTIGSRFWRSGGGFIYNLEAAYQFGTFGQGNISAWTGSADVGYVFDQLASKPSINLRNDYISGGENTATGTLNTFNPIYPKGGYFGFDPQIGPVNLIDIHPYATINVRPNIILQADVVCNWRYSLQDGLYRPSGNFNLPGAGSDKRYIGTSYLVSGVWIISRFLTFNTGVQYFFTGAFIDSVIPDAKNGLFIDSRIGYKF